MVFLPAEWGDRLHDETGDLAFEKDPPEDYLEVLREHLRCLRKRPRMYAVTKEAFMATATVPMNLAGINTSEIYRAHIDGNGGVYKGLEDAVTDEWARAVVDDALRRLAQRDYGT